MSNFTDKNKLLEREQTSAKYRIILKSIKVIFRSKYMPENKQHLVSHSKKSSTYFSVKNFNFIMVFLIGMIILPLQSSDSERIFLKCTGKFEINRGELIKPDWETSYININLDGLKSFIKDKGIKKEGSTLIRNDSYVITYRDKNNRTESKYKINKTYGNYVVDYPKQNRRLVGTCQKGRG